MTISSRSNPPFRLETKKGSSLENSHPKFFCLTFPFLYGGIFVGENIMFWSFFGCVVHICARFIDNALLPVLMNRRCGGEPFKAVDFTVVWNQNKEASIRPFVSAGANLVSKPFSRLKPSCLVGQWGVPMGGKHH